MKWKKATISLILILGLLIGFCLLLSYHSISKSIVTHYIQNHRSELETYVQNIDTNEDIRAETYNNWDVSYYPDSGMVEFLVSTRGFGPSSKYCGFYYSPQNIPVGYQEQNVELFKTETGWQWSDPDSDNQYYTEKITDHWYWFEMDF